MPQKICTSFIKDSSASYNGNMITLDVIKSINDECRTCEIESVDAQESPQQGVTVLVTGYLVGKDNVGRKFAQTFILAPLEKGYFIFKDMFRYIKDNESSQTNIIDEQDFEQGSVIQSSQSKDLADTTPEVQEDALKKSYASVVAESSVASSPVHATQVRRTISAITGHPSLGYADTSLVPEASAPGDDASLGKEQYSWDGHSIFVSNLPYDATVGQLGKEFKKFGSITWDGIQVKKNG
ncbi:nuclear transport factor 2 isoform X1 [Rosa chinensis]|uniref:nuclear transport factor 2 isoform X1 n=1 Tax=Rosa chinensis TaxID=74649 RepID=UPI000D08BE0F|nr:nuclear transport factor 2 isoform X1 [Rosa chinensis]XP_024166188.1 nuclear transport factor 2 isoform X1 [Rosa chinensis]XP_040364919.1 nuclear transport factor 2 isoform X1 [Rosa chinensis]XP_040364920.1 nuclear transport factor 2 isoform X1 [Rosa chinensis]XP_040364921.1 nuclear transport factor 2 isoform X1 [Rosa chinensis]